MKNIFLFLVLISLQNSLFAQDSTAMSQQGNILELKEKSFDFGSILQGRPVSHEFVLFNKGTDTLKMENVQASCGCTTPVWSKEPVAPNGSTVIKVGYNALAEGAFEKSVNIFFNGNQVKSVIIKGNVYKSTATSAPLNASIGFLKQIN